MKKEKVQIHLTPKQIEYINVLRIKLDITKAEALRRIIDDHMLQNDKK